MNFRVLQSHYASGLPNGVSTRIRPPGDDLLVIIVLRNLLVIMGNTGTSVENNNLSYLQFGKYPARPREVEFTSRS
jgi:hypothetical protein